MAEFRSASSAPWLGVTTLTITPLPTWQHGDLVVITMGWGSTGVSAWVDPPGWTAVPSSATVRGYYRVMQRGDVEPTVSWTTTQGGAWVAHSYVGPMTGVTLEASSGGTGNSTTIDPGAITTASSNALVIWQGMQFATSITFATPPTDYGLRTYSFAGAINYTRWGMDKTQATAGSTGSNAATTALANAYRVAVYSFALRRLAFQEVDPDDLSTVLFDYADTSGLQNTGSVKTWAGLGGALNLNAPGVTVSNTDRQGETSTDLTFTYDDVVETSFRMRMQASSYANLRAGLGSLQELLAADGVVRWCPNDTDTYYLYRKPSPIPALLSGQDLETFKALTLPLAEATVEVTMNRERLLRGPRLQASVNKLANATLLESTTSASTAMANWGWDTTANITTSGYGTNVNWATQSYRFTIATTGTRNFRNAAAPVTAAPGEVWTLAFDVKASGGTLAKAQAVIEFRAGAASLRTDTGTLTTLVNGADFVRLAVTTQTAPATTDNLLAHLRMTNGDATSYTVDFRRAQVERAGGATAFRVGSETVSGDIDDYNAKHALVYTPGDANALARVNLTPVASANTVAYLLGRSSESLNVNLTEAVNNMTSSSGSHRAIQLVISTTMYAGTTGDTSSQGDTGASNANAARTTFSNVPNLVRRWRWVNTPTDPEALHGTWSVYAAVKGDTGKTFRICMHWQAANRDPVSETGDVITYDTGDAGTSSYTPLYLGDVAFDADGGDAALVIEGWAACDSGTVGNLWWDVVYLVPADEQQTLVQVPGFRRGRQSVETWLGSELTQQAAGCKNSSVPSGSTKVVLDDQYEGVGTPPGTFTSGGVIWAAGRHKVSALVSLKEPSGTAATTVGRLRIRKAPGPGASLAGWSAATGYVVGNFVKPTAGNLNGRTFVVTSISGTGSGGSEPSWPATDGGTVTQNPGANQVVWTETTVASRGLTTKSQFNVTKMTKSVEYTADGTTAYEGVVVHSAAVATNQSITVLNMKHFTQRVVDSGYTVQVYSDTEALQTANGSTAIDDLVKQGPYITLGPGLNILWIDLWAQAPLAYDDMDPRGALALHDPSRTTAFSVDVIPRYWS